MSRWLDATVRSSYLRSLDMPWSPNLAKHTLPYEPLYQRFHMACNWQRNLGLRGLMMLRHKIRHNRWTDIHINDTVMILSVSAAHGPRTCTFEDSYMSTFVFDRRTFGNAERDQLAIAKFLLICNGSVDELRIRCILEILHKQQHLLTRRSR